MKLAALQASEAAKDGILYVADSESNRIAAIPNALHGMTTAYAGKDRSANGKLNGPLGLAIAPNGDILTVNSADGNLVETTPEGAQIAFQTITTNPPGSLFGLAVTPTATGVYFVDDTNNKSEPALGSCESSTVLNSGRGVRSKSARPASARSCSLRLEET